MPPYAKRSRSDDPPSDFYQPTTISVDEMQPEHVRARRADQIAKLTADIKRYEEYIVEAKAKLKFWHQVPA